MKINLLKVKNLYGLAGEHEFDLSPKIVGLFGHNGAGKSSTLNAMRFALSGIKNGSIMNANADSAAVCIETDSARVDRLLKRTATGSSMKCWVNRQSVVGATVQKAIADSLGTTTENLKILSSKDFELDLTKNAGKVLLSYATDTLSPDDVKTLLKQQIIENSNVCDQDIDQLPMTHPISWEQSKKIVDYYTRKRRAFSSDLKSAKSLLSSLKPVEFREGLVIPSLTDAQEELQKIAGEKAKAEFAKKQYALWEQQAKKRAESEALIKKFTEEMASIEVGTSKTLDELQNEFDSVTSYTVKYREEIAAAKAKIDALLPIYDKLGTGICPLASSAISIHCNTDMTETKADVKKQIDEAKDIVEQKTKDLEKSEEAHKVLATLIHNVKAKAELSKKIELIRSSMPEQMEKPMIPEQNDTAARENFLQTVIHNAQIKAQSEKLMDDCRRFSHDYAFADFLVKAFGEKGPIVCAILNKYMDTLSSAAAKAYDITGVHVLFSYEDGINIQYALADEDPRDYNSLSSGERLLAFLTVSDLLHRIAGIPVLVLDDLDKLDLNNLDRLLTLLESVSTSYENIILAGVDHNGVSDVLSRHKVKNLL
ncbi:AAA domain-containing protein [Lachnospiraceae bacterium KHCPX20]|nr:AAA domain-containing protein [Lachnospiraceae bacterium KHCPX20]